MWQHPGFDEFSVVVQKKTVDSAGPPACGLLLPFMAPKVTKDRVSYTFTQGIGRPDSVAIAGVHLDTSTSARIQSWEEAVRGLVQHPVLGFGITGYRFVDAQYVRVATETGFLGLFFFLLLLGRHFQRVLSGF